MSQGTVIRPARLPEEAPVLEGFLRDYIKQLVALDPDNREAIEAKYSDDKIPGHVAAYATRHAPPGGALLVAEAEDGTPLGTVMLSSREAGIGEIERLYLAPAARGHGLGIRLMEEMIAVARDLGHHTLRLDTGPANVEAMALYRKLGFRQRDAYHADHAELQDVLIYFELDLAAKP